MKWARILGVLICATTATLHAASHKPLVIFVTGDDEYRSEFSMPMIARIVETNYGFRTSVAYARPTPQTKNNIQGLEALKDADLAVFFIRFRRLPDDQMKLILDYLSSGKPIVGLRTATHGFLFPKGNSYERWNDSFGIDVFGQKWISHYSNESTTGVTVIPDQAANPILQGVAKEFQVSSWLYVVTPLHGDFVPLLEGKVIGPAAQNAVPQPVAWTKTYKGARVFYMSLGHPEDFKVESTRRLLVNGILWALGQEIPRNGAKVDIVGGYAPPPAGVPSGSE